MEIWPPGSAAIQPWIVVPKKLVATGIIDEDDGAASANRAVRHAFHFHLFVEPDVLEALHRARHIAIPSVEAEWGFRFAGRVARDNQSHATRGARPDRTNALFIGFFLDSKAQGRQHLKVAEVPRAVELFQADSQDDRLAA